MVDHRVWNIGITVLEILNVRFLYNKEVEMSSKLKDIQGWSSGKWSRLEI